MSGTDPVLQAPQKSGQGQHGEIPAAYPAVAARAGTSQLCRSGCGSPGETGRRPIWCGMRGASSRPRRRHPVRYWLRNAPRSLRKCSCPDLRRPRPGRTLDGGSRTAGLKGGTWCGQENGRGMQRARDDVATARRPTATPARKPTFLQKATMEGNSESQAQGDVASGNRAGIGNPQSHHKEIHGCRRPSNATSPGGCCCHAVI